MIQTINISLIPSDNKPVINVSQFDNISRVLRFNVFDDLGMETPHVFDDGDTVLLNIRKNDNNIVVITGVIVSDIDPETQEVTGQYLTFELTEQACACVGSNYGEVSITSGDDEVIGSCNFKLIVERSPLAGGINSQSEIDNLTTQIDQITEEVIGENYYTKTETDNLLSDKADSDDVYTKTETDNLLNAKADANSVYTKTETDNLLNAKADANSVYTKTETDNLLNAKADVNSVYTKTETDNLLNAKADANSVYTKTETDNLLNAKADANSVYTKTETDNKLAAVIDDSVTVNNKTWSSAKISEELYALLPVGSVSGAVASFNTALANPLISCVVDENATKLYQTGFNLTKNQTLNTDWYIGNISDAGVIQPNTVTCAYSDLIRCKPNVDYCISFQEEVAQRRIAWYDENGDFISRSSNAVLGKLNVFTSPNNACYCRWNVNYNNVLVSDTFTQEDIDTIKPCLNVSNVVKNGTYQPYNNNSTNYNLPLTDLPTTFSGDNNFFTDYGDITVQYKDTIANYIDTRVNNVTLATRSALNVARTLLERSDNELERGDNNDDNAR